MKNIKTTCTNNPLCPNGFFLLLDVIILGWACLYTEGPHKIDISPVLFVIANSVDADEMSHHVAFHLGLDFLPMM